MASPALAILQTDAAVIAAAVGERPGTAAAQSAVAHAKLQALLEAAPDPESAADTDALLAAVLDRCRDAALALEGRQSLVQIEDRLGLLLDAAEAVEDQPTYDRVCELILEYIDARADKIDAIAGYLAHCEERAEGAKVESERLTARRRQYERRAESLKAWVKSAMVNAGAKKFEGHVSTFSLRACPASVEIVDEAGIPGEFWREKIVRDVDKTSLKAALKALPDAESRMAAAPGAVLVTDKKALVRS